MPAERNLPTAEAEEVVGLAHSVAASIFEGTNQIQRLVIARHLARTG